MKPILVYFNPECFWDTDKTILKYLSEKFKIIYFFHCQNESHYVEEVTDYANRYGIILKFIISQYRKKSLNNIFCYKKIAKNINDINPDIVYSCELYPFWCVCYHSIKCKYKILGLHDVIRHSHKISLKDYLEDFIHKNIIRMFKNIFTFSYNQSRLLKEKYGKESVMVGMSYKYMGNSNLLPNSVADGIKLLFFGSIHYYKGLDLLLSAIEKLKSEGINNIKLTIAGNGSFWENCKNLIKSSELYELKIRFIENCEVPDLMNTHHFLVLPYRDATQSGPLLLALGYNLPIIAPKFGFFSEVFSEKSAILYSQGSLYNSIRRVAGITENEYDKLREMVYLVRDNYTEERIAEHYICAINTILKKDK